MTPQRQKSPLGILAGRGELPWIAARNARNAGEELRIFCLGPLPIPEEFRSLSEEVNPSKIYGSLLAALKRHNVRRVLLLGKIDRDVLYKTKGYELRVKFQLLRALSQSDYSLFQLGERILKQNGIEVLPQPTFLMELFLPAGRYGARLNSRELKDVAFGLPHARVLSQMNIGQSIVIGNCAILAVEAAEGSDKCIERGGRIFLKKGAVVCKIVRQDHDILNDIPTVGIDTLTKMHQSACRVLAFNATCTFIIHPKEFLKKAKEYHISIMALPSSEVDERYLKRLNANLKRDRIKTQQMNSLKKKYEKK